MRPREGAWWDASRIGIGPPPIETEHGWLLIYHGVKEMVGGAVYRVGLALLDRDQPTTVLHRLPEWILGPDAPYERTGDVPNTVFPCGAIHDPATDVRQAVLRRGGHLDLPRYRPARRPARRSPRLTSARRVRRPAIASASPRRASRCGAA